MSFRRSFDRPLDQHRQCPESVSLSQVTGLAWAALSDKKCDNLPPSEFCGGSHAVFETQSQASPDVWGGRHFQWIPVAGIVGFQPFSIWFVKGSFVGYLLYR